MKSSIDEYKEYINKIGDRTELYKSITDAFEIRSALYPGSHIDVSPSLVIPKVTYVDSFKGTAKFFKNMNEILNFIEEYKQYEGSCEMSFYNENYEKNLNLEKVDLIISQYAGFVGQATKVYLKKGGILLCNDSHGDATLAYGDSDYEFIGVINLNNMIDTENLEKYFKFNRSRDIDFEKVRKTMKGPKYQTKAENYIFRKKAV